MQNLLNEPLYTSLKKLFHTVKVSRPGDRGNFERVEDEKVVAGKVRNYVNYRVQPGGSYGETFAVNCPYCGDSRGRLQISYLFGYKESPRAHPNLGNVHCFNEECHTDYSNRRELYDDIKLVGFGERVAAAGESLEFEAGGATRELTETTRPGVCELLSSIKPESPHYRAVEYLRDERGFDIEILERHYGVEYLVQGYNYGCLAGRVWTPFFRGGSMVAWTARAIPGLCESDIKHFHSPGGLSGLLYGLGGAMRCRTACIVEGTADRWATGKPSVALLSKSLGAQKCARLFPALAQSSVEAVVILLDPEQPENEALKGKQHHIEITAAIVRQHWPGPVIPVYLPVHLDPGASKGGFLAGYLYNKMKEAGYAALGESLAGDVLSSTAAR